jgi:hypothetical protein
VAEPIEDVDGRRLLLHGEGRKGRTEEEKGRRTAEGGRRKEDGRRRKEEGGGRKRTEEDGCC